MRDEDYMRLAVEAAREGIAKGQTPFGACLVKDGAVVSCVHNVVWERTDITAHAEIHAIREACRILKTVDLTGCAIYSTCEPCPMCFSASHWARLSMIHYGARIEDAKQAGFNELAISSELMKHLGGSPLKVRGGLLREECLELFTAWTSQTERHSY
ncbi:MAG TPA: nucleoside deaminase [Nitrospiraceae bacterium]|nr:nucleoside deaminase [Nitrospiraceae bacterium]